MRHIKIYEDYSDDELKDLLGDMRSVGQSRVNLDIDYGPYHGMGEKEKEGERNIADNWSFEIPGGEDVRVKSGSIKVSPKKITRVVLNMTNGDVLELETDNKVLRTESFSINGEFPDPLQKSSWVMEDPGYIVDALTRYEHYLINKHKIGEKPPTFFQRLKKKIGLDESDYSDEELKDLLGDMRSVGQSRVNLDIDYGPFKGMGEKDKKEEKDVVDNWSFNAPAGKIEVKSGSIKFSPEKEGEVILNMTNGDVIRMKDQKGDDPLFSVNNKPIIDQEFVEEYPYTLAALSRYKLHLKNKYTDPSLLQRLKAKLGIKESEYSEDELKALLGDMRSVGQSLTEEEEDMLQFVNQFGGGMSAEDYAETLYDYYKNPGDYDIDPEGDYYDMIWYLYENSVEDHARFDLQGPMRMSMSPNWNIGGISNEPLYKMYLKMSDHYKSAKR